LAREHVCQPLGRQFAVNANAKPHFHLPRRALQTYRDFTVRGEYLEAAVDARHRAHGHEAPARPRRHACDQ